MVPRRGQKTALFSGSDGKPRNVTKKHSICYTLATSATPQNDIFLSFPGPKNTSKPRGNRMDQKYCQNAPRKLPARIQKPKLVPTGRQKDPKGFPQCSKNRILGVLGHRCDPKVLQGFSGHPPRLKMEPKLHRNRQRKHKHQIAK